MTSLPVVETHLSCVSRVPLFSGLTPDAQQTVGSYAQPSHLAKGELLHSPGSDLAQLFVVHSGRLKVVRVTAGGFERLLRVAKPGDVVGENAFLTGQRPDTYVEALENTSDYLLELPSQRGPRGAVASWPLSKREVASYLGTTPESLSRALATLESLDLIVGESRRSTILLDVDGLEELATS